MKILVTGYTGQLGYDVVREGQNRKLTMVGIGQEDLDITDEEAVFRYVREVSPDAIIHCAAYTAVDKAEDDPDTCQKVNVDGTMFLAQAAKEVNAAFMYISTDYVFDGQGESHYTEEDEAAPIGIYGVTKLAGERVVQSLLERHFIVRISWVFGFNGNNFVKTMIRLGQTRDVLNVVGDQIGSPTYTLDVSRLLIDMIQTGKYGIYHATNEGLCSWHEFATEILNRAGIPVKVLPISTEEYPTRAFRPKNSRLSKKKLADAGFVPLPDWKDAVSRYLKELQQEVK